MKKFISLLFVLLLLQTTAFGEFEDLQNDYTEVDPNSNITISDTQAVVEKILDGTNASVYKDFTSSHFGEFSHEFNLTFTAEAGTYTKCNSWTVSNIAGATIVDMETANSGISVGMEDGLGGNNFFIQNYADDSKDQPLDVSLPRTAYFTVERTGVAINCYVYNDSAKTDLFDTLTVTFSNTTFQYLNAVTSGNNPSDTESVSFTIRDININEAATPITDLSQVFFISKQINQTVPYEYIN